MGNGTYAFLSFVARVWRRRFDALCFLTELLTLVLKHSDCKQVLIINIITVAGLQLLFCIRYISLHFFDSSARIIELPVRFKYKNCQWVLWSYPSCFFFNKLLFQLSKHWTIIVQMMFWFIPLVALAFRSPFIALGCRTFWLTSQLFHLLSKLNYRLVIALVVSDPLLVCSVYILQKRFALT